MIRFVGILLLFVCASSHAAIITVSGNDVDFTYDTETLFGTGNVVGNSIFFSPTTFVAESNDTDGLVTTAETLSISVVVTSAGLAMEKFGLNEQGGYMLNGTSTSVSATGTFTADSDTSAFSDSGSLSAGALTVQGALTNWEINSLIDLTTTAGWNQDSAVTLTLDNTLAAESTVLGDSANIQKTFGAVGVAVTMASLPVPVPAAFYLFCSALGLLGWSRRRT